MKEYERVKKLEPVHGKVHIVLDTDTKNEVDDQFALAYAYRLHQMGELYLDAVYAAPFTHHPSPTPGEGMEQSYDEIKKVLSLIGRTDIDGFVFKGSDRFLDGDAVDSPAARDLIDRAMKFSPEEPLYVVAIGAITNIASAILMKPEIIDRIVVVWLGGTDMHCTWSEEYNLMQDAAASRIIFDCGVPLVQLPCEGVVSNFRTCVSELEKFIDGKTEIGTYLTSLVRECDNGNAYTRVIWDVTAVGYVYKPELFKTTLVHSPRITEEPVYSMNYHVLDCYKDQGFGLSWTLDDSRHLIRVVKDIDRDGLYYDLFCKINKS